MKDLHKKKIHIGCQAWGYADWVSRPGETIFYPQGTRDADKLRLYAEIFDLIELDTAVYGTPSLSNIENWCRKTPEGFIFAPKLPNAITHKGLLEPSTWPVLDEFCEQIRNFNDKLGPTLILLPPQFEPLPENAKTLRHFLGRLPEDLRFALEFRHAGWLTEQTYDDLEKYGVALCLAEGRWIPRGEFFDTIKRPTAGFAYIRFSGPRDLAAFDRISRNMDKNLSEWAAAIRDIPAKEIFVLFSNFYEGHAPASANKLKVLLGLEYKDPALLEKQGSLF
jgi:uncharacterized protein YecE (DUF72 family)